MYVLNTGVWLGITDQKSPSDNNAHIEVLDVNSGNLPDLYLIISVAALYGHNC